MPSSTGKNIFRHGPDDYVVKEVTSRNTNKGYTYKTRYNAYVTITSSTGGTLPNPGTGFDDTYSTGAPTVILNSVKISEASDFGLLRQVDVEFTCPTKAVFDTYEPLFLRVRSGNDTITVNVRGGYVGRGGQANSFELKDLMIYKFSYKLDKNNMYVCTFSAMGSARLVNETDVHGSNKLADITGLTFRDPATAGFSLDIPVRTIPQLLKHEAQSLGGAANGFTVDIPVPQVIKLSSNGVFQQIVIVEHPNNWTPESFGDRALYVTLQALGLAGSDDSSKVIYCDLCWLIEAINKWILSGEKGNLSNKRYVCNSTVTSGAYLEGVCSSDPLNILITGNSSTGYLGYYGSMSGLANDEQLRVGSADIPGLSEVVNGTTGDYSKILLSYNYLASKQWGRNANDKKTPDAAKKPTYGPDDTKFSVGTLLKGIFDDISAATGGAIVLTAVEDPDDPTQILIVPTNEDTQTITPVRFNPINGDGITREATISCNPPASDAYAVAAGPAAINSSTAEATSGTPQDLTAEKRSSTIQSIKELKDITLAASQFSSEQSDSMRTALRSLVTAASPEHVATGKVPSTSTQWPLNLQITLDGIYGFKFGDIVETTFLPGSLRSVGLSPAFMVTRVTHTIANNDWSTQLETVCTLINKA